MKKFLVVLVILFLSVFIIGQGKEKWSNSVKGVRSDLIRGLILPHHDLARELIIQSLEKVGKNPAYNYVVILGPEHFTGGKGRILTSTQIGQEMMASDLINNLVIQNPNLVIDQTYLEKEHSITTLLPYLQHYLPSAKIVPIVLSPDLSSEEMDKVVQSLLTTMPPETLFLGSIDFSHKKTVLEAMENNRQTLEIMNNFDYLTLSKLKDDYLDSPVSMAILLKIMQAQKTTSWETWYSSHGAILTGDPSLQGTSYILGVFR